MRLSLDDLALIVAIADQGGFSAAARALGLPKSTVSRRLAEVEALLGTTLFRRSTRALSMTDDGARIHLMAKPAIDAANAIAAAIADREMGPSGRVVITTTAALGQQMVAPFIADLTGRHQALQVELRLTEERVSIVDEGIDLAIRMGELEPSELVARRLSDVRRLLVAAPGYLDRAGRPATLSDLANHEAVVTSAALATWRFADGQQCSARWRIAAGNMLVARDLTLAGNGIALLPDFMVDDDLAEKRLEQVLSTCAVQTTAAWIISTRQRHRSFAVRAVMDHLVNACNARRLRLDAAEAGLDSPGRAPAA